jgi:hypothetical protein
MSTCEVKLFVPKGCFTAYVSGMTVVDEIFCPPLYYCDQKILDTNVIVLSYILKRPLCINNLNFDCVNFENVNVRFTEKIFKKL